MVVKGISTTNGTHAPSEQSHPAKHQQGAIVQLLDGTKSQFLIDRNADGSVLFQQIINVLNLGEKDYFALSFRDSEGNRNWVYSDKRIAKQLKGRPWDFQFEVKFYPPEPSSLSEDLTRYYLCLQVRRDIYTGKLSASFVTHALLGSYVAQSEVGDLELVDKIHYDDYLRNAQLAPRTTQELFDKVRELHRNHKGQTPAEAESHYLENVKKLTMYGVDMYPAKDGKGNPVTLGVCAHGLMVYRDQIRINRFAWPKIIKIAYRRNIFSIKLRPGELERNETSAAYKLADYRSSKRVWKVAVEHHTFFRLMQPEDKPKRGPLRWGSVRFRYDGRTQFQSKMASQMFDRPAPSVQRSQSARFSSRSVEQISVPIGPSAQQSPLHFVDESSLRDKLATPEKVYRIGDVARSKTEDQKKRVSTKHSSDSSSDSEDEKGKKSKQKLKKVAMPVVNGEHKTERSQQGHREPNLPKDGKLVKTVKTSEVYRLSGIGQPPDIDNENPSLERAIELTRQSNDGKDPKVELIEKHETTVASTRDQIPDDIRFLLSKSGGPHTTIRQWEERENGPEKVETETDEHGNIIKRTTKSEQLKQTVQRQTYQTYSVAADGESEERPSKLLENQSHAMSFETKAGDGGQVPDNVPGEFVSSRTVTSGNRTVETITYKTEKDGVIETHVEHRVTIHSTGDDVDHDSELNQAIMEATQMNPELTVEKIEVKQESQC